MTDLLRKVLVAGAAVAAISVGACSKGASSSAQFVRRRRFCGRRDGRFVGRRRLRRGFDRRDRRDRRRRRPGQVAVIQSRFAADLAIRR